MLNKPKYTLLKNTTYALSGLKDVIVHESSFKLQVLLFVVMSVVSWFLPVEHVYSLILNGSLFIPIMAEVSNSAIERVVDLVTLEHHEMAGRAKDVGAALVFISLILTAYIWIGVLAIAFEII